MIRHTLGLTVLSSLLFYLPCSALADPIFIRNHSFENPDTKGLAYADSWEPVGNNDFTSYNVFQLSPSNYYNGADSTTDPVNGGRGYPGIDGRHLAFVYQQGIGTGIQQTLNAVLEANARYTLTVSVGCRNGIAFGSPSLGSSIELMAGDTVIASSQDDIGPPAGMFENQVAVLDNSDTFAHLVGQPLSIRLRTTLSFTITHQATDWDNVRLDVSPVTQP